MIKQITDMIVSVSDKQNDIESVLFHDAIFNCISEDGASKHIPNGFFITAKVGDVCIGVVIVEEKSSYLADVHIQVIPEFRNKYALQFAKHVINMLFSSGYVKLTASVPFCFENVKNFAERAGFEVEGINRSSWLKHGKLWDSWYLGIVRGDQWAD